MQTCSFSCDSTKSFWSQGLRFALSCSQYLWCCRSSIDAAAAAEKLAFSTTASLAGNGEPNSPAESGSDEAGNSSDPSHGSAASGHSEHRKSELAASMDPASPPQPDASISLTSQQATSSDQQGPHSTRQSQAVTISTVSKKASELPQSLMGVSTGKQASNGHANSCLGLSVKEPQPQLAAPSTTDDTPFSESNSASINDANVPAPESSSHAHGVQTDTMATQSPSVPVWQSGKASSSLSNGNSAGADASSSNNAMPAALTATHSVIQGGAQPAAVPFWQISGAERGAPQPPLKPWQKRSDNIPSSTAQPESAPFWQSRAPDEDTSSANSEPASVPFWQREGRDADVASHAGSYWQNRDRDADSTSEPSHQHSNDTGTAARTASSQVASVQARSRDTAASQLTTRGSIKSVASSSRGLANPQLASHWHYNAAAASSQQVSPSGQGSRLPSQAPPDQAQANILDTLCTTQFKSLSHLAPNSLTFMSSCVCTIF